MCWLPSLPRYPNKKIPGSYPAQRLSARPYSRVLGPSWRWKQNTIVIGGEAHQTNAVSGSRSTFQNRSLVPAFSQSGPFDPGIYNGHGKFALHASFPTSVLFAQVQQVALGLRCMMNASAGLLCSFPLGLLPDRHPAPPVACMGCENRRLPRSGLGRAAVRHTVVSRNGEWAEMTAV